MDKMDFEKFKDEYKLTKKTYHIGNYIAILIILYLWFSGKLENVLAILFLLMSLNLEMVFYGVKKKDVEDDK